MIFNKFIPANSVIFLKVVSSVYTHQHISKPPRIKVSFRNAVQICYRFMKQIWCLLSMHNIKLLRILGLIIYQSFVNVETFVCAEYFSDYYIMIVLPKFAIIGNNRSGNFGRSIFPTHAFDFQHIAIFYPLELFPFV